MFCCFRHPCRVVLRWAAPIAWLVAVGGFGAADSAWGSDEARHFEAFQTRIQPLLARYCVDCHGGSEPEADLSLDKYDSELAIARDRKQWQRVLEMAERGEMPPPDAPPLPLQDRAELLAWVKNELARTDCQSANVYPGRTTLRRLNRVQYANTIRDLVGIEFQGADDFPSDDVGYGFDHIGDVLSLPPILMEKYLDAAEQITQQAIEVRLPATSQTLRVQAKYLTPGDPRARRPDRKARYHVLASNGEMYLQHQFPHPGEYVLLVKAFGHQAGPEPARMVLRIDDRDVHQVDVKATEEKPAAYEVRLRVDAGMRRVAVAFVNDYYDPKNEDPKLRGDRNLGLEYLEIRGPTKVEYPPLPESHRRIVFVQPDGNLSKRDAARKIIDRFASRAFRRPARSDEVDRLLAIFGQLDGAGEPFERAIQVCIQAVLVSPHFLFLVEQDRPADGNPPQPWPVSDYELASRLSYFLWSSMPDDELFALAGAGQLREKLAEQVRRMLADKRSQALVENFAGQWLQLRNLEIAAPDPKQFASFDSRLRADMVRETELFFAAVMRENRSVLDFLTADYTFLNERLANHYGIGGVKGEEFRRVVLKDSRRGGVLTQASVLTVTSNPTRTSPVKRGKWILETILGTPPPPPPPDVPELDEAESAALTGTLRQRFEQHRTNPTCASCHSRMDPLGFGFENYDAIGRWRQRDGKFEIDASGTLPTGESFAGPHELKQLLAGRREQFAACLSEKLLTYALGRGLEYYDQCAVDEIAARLAADEYRFVSLVLAIVDSRPFQFRSPPRSTP